MQVLKDELRQSIIDSAKYEFNHNGYEKSSIRRIAKRAGMTVGNVYRYFDSKEAILDEIVRPAYSKVIDLVNTLPFKKKELQEDSRKTSQYLVDSIVNISREHYEALLILTEGCKGTPYESAKEEVISLAENLVRTVIFEKLKEDGLKIEDEFLAYVIASGFIEGVFLILKHFKDPNKMKPVLAQYHRFYMKNSIERLK